MLRSNAQLSADMVLAEFPQKSPVSVRQQIIETESRADEDLFDPRKSTQLLEECQVISVIDFQVGTRLREEAAAVLAGAQGHLLFAGRGAELRGRTADIIDIAFEIRLLQHLPGFLQNGFVAADLHDTALVKSKSAEIAVPVTAAVGGKAETDLTQSRHTARRVVHGVPGAHIGQGINIVHLPHGERLCRRILNYKSPAAVGLIQALCLKRIRVRMLQCKAHCIGQLPLLIGFTHALVIGQADSVVDVLFPPCLIYGSVYICDVPYIHSAGQCIGNFHNTALSHSVGDQVRARLEQNGPAHAVRPVVIVGHTPQARLETAQDDGCLFKSPADQVSIDHDRIVRPFSHHSARRKRVAAAVLFVDRIMIDHGVHVAGGNQEAQSGLSQHGHTLRIAPVRLADHPDRVAS